MHDSKVVDCTVSATLWYFLKGLKIYLAHLNNFF